MNIGSGPPHDRDGALTPEESALADRIARLGPQGEPSPALDARILAAARASDGARPAAAAAPAHRPSRHGRPRRWPVAFGAAATLAIVGGLAWQLRPVDELQVDYSEAPRVASGPSADAMPRPVPQTDRDVAQPVAEATPAAAASAASTPAAPMHAPAPVATGRAANTEATSGGKPKAFASGPPIPAEPPVTFDEPSPMDTPSPPAELQQLALPAPARPAPLPPPPPPAPAASFPPQPAAGSAPAKSAVDSQDRARAQRAKASETAARRAPSAQVASGIATQPARRADAAAAADASVLDRVELGGVRAEDEDEARGDPGYVGDQPLDDQPPASVDSPQVRQAWLQRVRQLIAEGRTDAARDSLREYQRRYPTATLPDDLRALLAR